MTTQRQFDVNGWYEVKRNPLSRVGVFPYRGSSVDPEGEHVLPDAVVRVFRPEEELADPECLESFKLLPWVDEHTMLGPDDGLTPAEAKGVQGVIGEEIVFDAGTLYGNIKLFSNSMGRLIEAGKRQLSAGYRCVYDWTAGIWNGQPYDCVQRQIRGNHLALVQEGRMGPSVAVMDHFKFTFDAQEAVLADPENKPADGGAGSMTLEEVTKTLAALAPQVAELQKAFAALSAPPAADADPDDPTDGAAEDNKPPAPGAKPAPAAAPAAAAPAAQPAAASAQDEALKPILAKLDALGRVVAAMDTAIKGMPAAMAADTAARDKLADRLADVVGTFDAADKSLQQVAEYGAEKLGLKAPKGHELLAVESYLAAASKAPRTVRHAEDAAVPADNPVARWISGDTK